MPKLIGICGGSCSGKTTLVKALKEKFGDTITTLSFDEYFVGNKALKNKTIEDWESPTLYNHTNFIQDLTLLKENNTINVLCNSRESAEKNITHLTIKPKKIVFVEGFLIFHNKKARNLFDVKIFIDISNNEMIRRRIDRTKETMGGWNNADYIKNKLVPGHNKHVLPQRNYADLILDGTNETDILIEQLVPYSI